MADCSRTRCGGGGLYDRKKNPPTSDGPLVGKRVLVHLKTIVQAQFPEPKKVHFPCPCQELLYWLHGQRVEVAFNGSLAHLSSLYNDVHDIGQLEPIAKPLSLAELLHHRQRADLYRVYEWRGKCLQNKWSSTASPAESSAAG